MEINREGLLPKILNINGITEWERQKKLSNVLKKYTLNDEINISDMFFDRYFKQPFYETAKGLAKFLNHKFYLIRFSYFGNNSYTTYYTNYMTNPTDFGVAHGDNTIYLIRSLNLFRDFEHGSNDEKLSKIYTKMITNFAGSGGQPTFNKRKLVACNKLELLKRHSCQVNSIENVDSFIERDTMKFTEYIVNL